MDHMQYKMKFNLWLMLLLIIFIPKVWALPSFARQTGLACTACHTVFPELTTYGRNFKLDGYTAVGTRQIRARGNSGGVRLEIDNTPPLSVMFQLADVFTSPPTSLTVSSSSDGRGSLEFPTQFSFFYAGRISPDMGGFIQATYDPTSGTFAMDNTDLRWAKRFQVDNRDLVIGLTANNNPTVQDVFNDTPAWSFPYAVGSSAVEPQMNPIIDTLGGSVGGLGAYVFWNQSIYAEVSAYRTAYQGTPASADIQGLAPYWRLALTKNFGKNSIEVGTFGMSFNSYPNGVAVIGVPNQLVDTAVDAQYQYVGKTNIITIKGNWINENQYWNYSSQNAVTTVSNPTDNLKAIKCDVTYYYNREVGGTVGYFDTTGTSDPQLYSATAGYFNNIPDSEGSIFEANYLPWYNTKFTVQYTIYNRFNGATLMPRFTNGYNTLTVLAWLMF
jgi:hypothetical protein